MNLELNPAAKTKTIFLFGYFGAGNIGDELILTAFLTMLDSRGAPFDVIVASGECGGAPAHYAARYPNLNIRVIKRSKNPLCFNNVRAFYSSCAFIMPGGGIFQDYGVLSFLCYYSFLLCAKAAGDKNYLLYQGFTGIKKGFFKKMMNFASSRLIDYISVRDEKSAKFLPDGSFQNGCGKGIYTDPAFALNTAVRKAVEENGRHSGGERFIGFSLRPWKGSSADDIAGALLKIIEKTGFKIKLYSMQKKTDCDLNAAVVKSLKGHAGDKISMVEYAPDVFELARSLAENELNLGMRFHFTAVSMMAGVPCIGIAYDEKVSKLYESAGISELCVSKTDFSSGPDDLASELICKIRYVVENRARLAETVEKFAAGDEKKAGILFGDFYEKCLA